MKIRSYNIGYKAIVFAVPIHLLAKSVSIPIDSTGVKENSGHFTLSSEILKYVKEAYLEAYADTPTATDASVAVELYNVTDGAVVASITFAGAGGSVVSSDIASSIANLVGKVLSARINVKTASATAGATQTFRSIVLRLVIGIS